MMFSYLDGWSNYSHHSVFKAAWELTATVPNTPRWANVLCVLLRNCEPPPTSFDPIPVLSRWHHLQHDQGDYGVYLRSRLADLLKADDALLNSNDPALRKVFYRRFNPASYQRWPDFEKADDEHFLDEALWNPFLWHTAETRSALLTSVGLTAIRIQICTNRICIMAARSVDARRTPRVLCR